MGQKTNPIGNRLGIIRGWESNWYGGNDYGDKLAEDDKIRKYLYARLAKAELRFCIDYEMVQNPMDFFIRRTGRLYFDIDSVRNLMEPILEEFKNIYGTDDAQILTWRETLQQELEEHSDFSMDRAPSRQ